jgi:predicted TPR repeat methyltransferase
MMKYMEKGAHVSMDTVRRERKDTNVRRDRGKPIQGFKVVF